MLASPQPQDAGGSQCTVVVQDVLSPQINCTDGVEVTIGETLNAVNGPTFAPFPSGMLFSVQASQHSGVKSGDAAHRSAEAYVAHKRHARMCRGTLPLWS